MSLPITSEQTLYFDHIGIVVEELKKGRGVLSAMNPTLDWTGEVVDPLNGVRIQFARDRGGVYYELLEPFGSDSPVSSVLTTGHAILNHIAYRVADLDEAGAHLRQARCARTAAPRPAVAYGGARIQFFVTPLRFIVELIEIKGDIELSGLVLKFF